MSVFSLSGAKVEINCKVYKYPIPMNKTKNKIKTFKGLIKHVNKINKKELQYFSKLYCTLKERKRKVFKVYKILKAMSM